MESSPILETPETVWEVYEGSGYSFKYPKELPYKYVDLVDWPPEVQLVSTVYECTESGNAQSLSGSTEEVFIDGQAYCRSTVLEGAAGSTYAQYTYLFVKDSNQIKLTFSVRIPQCTNFTPYQMELCESQVMAFNPDLLAYKLNNTLVLSE